MKKLFCSLFLLFAVLTSQAQTPAITMTTTKVVSSTFTFGISTTAENTPIQVDWGNGVITNYTIGVSYVNINGALAGNTVIIYGNNISTLGVNYLELTLLDVTMAPTLKYLSCAENQLTSLNISNNSALTQLHCDSNQLSFCTLPIKQPTWTDYTYSQQASLKLSKTLYSINEIIDLSSQLNVDGNTTEYVWKTYSGSTLLKGVDYTEDNGKFIFPNGYGDYIKCQMTNASLPNTILYTEYVSITPTLPVITMVTTTSIGSTFSFEVVAHVTNSSIQVDWGNGTTNDYTIGSGYYEISGSLAGSTIKIYGVGINFLVVDSKNLTSLDVSGANALTDLYCSNNQLTSLDISKNFALRNLICASNNIKILNVSNNTFLVDLWCYENQLTELDISKNSKLIGLYCYSNQITSLDVSNNPVLRVLYCHTNQLTTLIGTDNKLKLEDLQCHTNKLTTLNLQNTTTLTNLYCYSNQLSALDVSNNIALTKLFCSSNKLTSLDLSQNTAITQVNCNSNQLTTLNVPNNVSILEFNCDENMLTYTTLPLKQPTWTVYRYWPQATIKLSRNRFNINETIDLSSQVTAGGHTTLYVWKTVSGKTLVKDIDYTEVNGTFSFLKEQGDYFYCQMTNASFPGLTLTTENISIPSSSPTITMITSSLAGSSFIFDIEATANNSLVHIDWGIGSFTDYTIGTSSSNITGTLAGNSIKIYGVGISSIDLSSKKLTALEVSVINALKSFNCGSNLLTFKTLPIKQSTWTTYTYSPQAKMKLPKKNYTISDTINLSSQLAVNGNTTTFIWKTKGGSTLISGTDYNITNGVTTFLKVQSDSVYCQMTNSTFPGLTLSTTNVKITQFLTTINKVNSNINIYPNPVKESLNIDLAENIEKVEVFTITGLKVYEKQGSNSNKQTIPTSDLPKGMLIVKVHTEDGVLEKKVIKE